MRILALDSCFNYGSVAVSESGKIISEVKIEKQFAQSSQLVKSIEICLEKAGFSYQDIDFIAATKGPGSFTGIRVTLATANAISFAAKKKLIGITSLAVLSYQSGVKGNCFVMLNAYRNQFYIQEFFIEEIPREISETQAVDYADINKYSEQVIITDSKDILLEKGFKSANIFEQKDIYASKLALLAENMIISGRLPEDFINPCYIRPPDAKISTKVI